MESISLPCVIEHRNGRRGGSPPGSELSETTDRGQGSTFAAELGLTSMCPRPRHPSPMSPESASAIRKASKRG